MHRRNAPPKSHLPSVGTQIVAAVARHWPGAGGLDSERAKGGLATAGYELRLSAAGQPPLHPLVEAQLALEAIRRHTPEQYQEWIRGKLMGTGNTSDNGGWCVWKAIWSGDSLTVVPVPSEADDGNTPCPPPRTGLGVLIWNGRPGMGWNISAPIPIGGVPGPGLQVREFFWTCDGPVGVLLGDITEQPFNLHPTLDARLALRTPSLSRTETETLVATHACVNPWCGGPRGHLCLRRMGHGFPEPLWPLVQILGITTDVLADAAHVCGADSISKWYSPYPADRAAGASGDAMEGGWQEDRVLVHLPADATLSDLWATGVKPWIKTMTEGKSEGIALVLGPSHILQDAAAWGPVCMPLAQSRAPGLVDPKVEAWETDTEVTSDGKPWQLWLMTRDPKATLDMAGWNSVKAALLKWPDAQLTASFTKPHSQWRKAAAALAAKADADRTAKLAAQIQALAARVAGASTARGKTSAANALRAVILDEAIRRRKARPPEDCKDLEETYGEHAHTWLTPSQLGRDSLDALDQGDDEGLWTPFFMRARNLWLDMDWPRMAVGRNETPVLLQWKAANDHIHEVHSRGIGQEGMGEGDRIRVTLRRQPPLITQRTRAAIYCDIGANDLVMKVVQAGPGDQLIWEAVLWNSFIEDMNIVVIPGESGHPMRRFQDAWAILMTRWKMNRAELLDDDDDVSSEDEHKDPEHAVMPWEQPPHPTLPGVTYPQAKSAVSVPLKRPELLLPEDKRNYEFAVTQAVMQGATPEGALTSAAKECRMQPDGQDPQRVPAGRRKRKRDCVSTADKDVLQRALRAVKRIGPRDLLTNPDVRNAANLHLDIQNAVTEVVAGKSPMTQLKALIQSELVQAQNTRVLLIECRREERRRKRREAAAKLWESDRSAAYKLMTKARPVASSKSVAQKAALVQDRGKRLEDATRANQPTPEERFGPYYSPDPAGQWNYRDAHTKWDQTCVVPAQADPSPDPAPHATVPRDFPLGFRQQRATEDYFEWLLSGPTPIGTVHDPDVKWPTDPLDDDLAPSIMREIERDLRAGLAKYSSNGTAWVKLEDDCANEFLRPYQMRINGEMPEWILVTDGSGTRDKTGLAGPGGFGGLLMCPGEAWAFFGANEATTSGEMEMGGVAEGLRRTRLTQGSTAPLVLSLSDYASWIAADLEALRTGGARKMAYPKLWAGAIRSLVGRASKDPRARLARVHTSSHKTGDTNWGQKLNDIVDQIASAAKEWHREGILRRWSAPCPSVTIPMGEIDAALCGPMTAAEVRAQKWTRNSNATDTNGLHAKLAKHAGSAWDEEMARHTNDQWFEGLMPPTNEKGQIWSVSYALKKPDGGDRLIHAPDTIQGIRSAVLAQRMLEAIPALRAIDRSQKCNIPSVAGCEEHLSVLVAAMYDFKMAAVKKQLRTGDARIWIFGDISKAFDRAQLPVILQAVRTILPTRRVEWLMSLICSLYERARVVVNGKDVAVLVEKWAGVHQGDPMSAIIFIILMEFAKRLIPPGKRHKVRFRQMAGEQCWRIEMDYADDQIRMADSVPAAQDIVDSIRESLSAVELQWNPEKVIVLALMYEGPTKGIRLFDPRLTAGLDAVGNQVLLRSIKPGEYVKALGLRFNEHGEFRQSEEASQATARLTNTRIAQSPFPKVAKLEAVRMVSSKQHEHLCTNVWLSPAVLDAMAKAERKTMRDIVMLNITNAAALYEFRLGWAPVRHQVMYLGSLVKRLGSTDPLTKATAFMMSKDAEPQEGRRPGKLEPPFFDWSNRTLSIGRGLTDTPVRYAWLAAKWGLGIEMTDSRLVVTLDGRPIARPERALKALMHKANRQALEQLLLRQSTNMGKELAPRFALTWGMSSEDVKTRKADTAFLGPESKYSDQAISILAGFRYCSLQTRVYKAYQTASNNNTSAVASDRMCGCGRFEQTTWHLLTVPATCNFHSFELRNINQTRHAKGLQWLANLLGGPGGQWRVVEVEAGSKGQQHNDKHSRAAARVKEALDGLRLQWSSDERQKPPEQRRPLHYKPDLVLVRTGRNGPCVRIVDMAFRTDTHLRREEEWSAKPPEESKVKAIDILWDAAPFDEKGSVAGPRPADWPVAVYAAAQALPRLVQAQYACRYKRLRADLRTRLQASALDVQVIVVAVGVMGYAPKFTRSALDELLGKKNLSEPALPQARRIAWDNAVLAWKAFSREP